MDNKIRKSKYYNSKENPWFYYSDFYDIYIYVSKDEKAGYIYPVEKIWVVEGTIID